MNRRAQLTGFLITGVVILLLVGLFYAVYFHPSAESSQQTFTSKDGLPIYTFVQSCMDSSLYQLLQTAALQGGYIDTSMLQVNSDPLQSDAVKMTAYSAVPYWYYLNANQLFSSTMLPLEGKGSVTESIQQAFPAVLEQCLDGFSSFSSEYLVEHSQPSVAITFKDQEVDAHLAMPTTVHSLSDGKETSITDYYSTIPVPFKQMYQVAQKVTEAETESHFLEYQAINLISLYSGMDSPLPPMSHYEIGSNRFRYWVLDNVKQVVKQDILSMIPLLQVVNTLSFHPVILANYTTPQGKIDQGIYNSMSVEIDKPTVFYPYQISFRYPDTPISLSVGGSELIMPRNPIPTKNFLLDAIGLSIYEYDFDYDLSFPVIASITQKNGYEGKDFTFQFALEANIRNSIPLTGQMQTKASNAITGLMYGDPTYYSQKNVTITVLDALNSSLIPAHILYECGADADLGETNRTVLRTRLPFCMFNGVIVAEAPGYLNGILPFNYDDRGTNLTIRMWPEVNRTVEAELIDPSDLASTVITPAQLYRYGKELPKDYKVLVSLERIKDFPQEQNVPEIGVVSFNFDQQAIQGLLNESLQTFAANNTGVQMAYDPSTDFPELNDTIALVPGRYQIQVYGMVEKNITIPAKTDTICPCGKILNTCLCKTENVAYPKENLPVLPLGNAAYNITITPQQLYSSSKLMVYLEDKPLPRTWDDMTSFFSEQQESPLLTPNLR